MIISYKYRLKGKRAGRRLSAHARAVNIVWNYCVETQKEIQKRWKRGQKTNWPSFYDLCYLTSGVSKELDVHAQTVLGVNKQFSIGRDHRKKCPKFRSSKKSLGWIPFEKQSRQITPNSITYLGHTYKFFGAKKRLLPSSAKGGHFVEDSRGRWWVSFYVEVKPDENHGDKEVGLDLGLKYLVTTSDGEKYENPGFYRKHEDKVKRADLSNNRSKQRSVHSRIVNSRLDYLHKLSNKLVRESRLIVVGNINLSKLGQTMMAKSVYDAGLGKLRSMLQYKASRHGVKYLEVNEAFTTQTCSQCGQRPPERPKGIAGLEIREWTCSLCGTHHDRDVNAAKNILILGRGAAPPVEGSRSLDMDEGAQKSILMS